MQRQTLIFTFAGLVSACGPGDKTISFTDGAGNPASITFKIDDHQVEHRAAPGSVTIRDQTRSSQFPLYAPAYPDALLVSEMNFVGVDGMRQVILRQRSKDDVATIIDFYKRHIVAGGFRITADHGPAEARMLIASSPRETALTVLIMTENNGNGVTDIGITIINGKSP